MRRAVPLPAWMLLGALACASTDAQPIDDPALELEQDEIWLRTQADQMDALLASGAHLLPDAELQRYLDRVAQRLVLASGAHTLPVRVRVLLDPDVNAFALPNGSIYLDSGLLARMQNEAQLASVLGRELAHYRGRHVLREQHTQEAGEALLALLLLGVAIGAGVAANSDALANGLVAGIPSLNPSNDLAELTRRVQVAGYSRELERESDARSLEMLRGAGYEPGQSLAAFELLAAGADAEATDVRIPSVYTSSPKIEERIESLTKLLEDQPANRGEGRVGEEEFQERTTNLMLANAELEIATHALIPAQRGLERYVRLRPTDPAGLRMLAEAYRRAGPEREHVSRAATTLEQAAALAPEDAVIRRELGLLYRELDDRDRAQASLTRYLALAPDASDRAIIERFVAELQ